MSTDPTAAANLPLLFGAITNQGGRANNEDSFLVADPPDPRVLAARGRLIVVADGMGGAEGGELASKLVVETIRDTYYAHGGGDVAGALAAAVLQANAAVHGYSLQHPELRGMGSTVVAVVLHEGWAWYAHVGDSRAYLMRNHQLYPLTEDHTRVNQMRRDGFITEAEARVHPQKHVLNRSMGPGPTVEVEVCPEPVELQNGDRLVLCSDGLSDTVHEAEVAWFIDHHQPQSAVEKLVGFVMERHADYVARGERDPKDQDNVTIQVVQVGRPQKGPGTQRPAAGRGAPPTQIMEHPVFEDLAVAPVTEEPVRRQPLLVWILGGVVAALAVALVIVMLVFSKGSGDGGSGKDETKGSDGTDRAAPSKPADEEPMVEPADPGVPRSSGQPRHGPGKGSMVVAATPRADVPIDQKDWVDAGDSQGARSDTKAAAAIDALEKELRCLPLIFSGGDPCRRSLRRVFDASERRELSIARPISGVHALYILGRAEEQGWNSAESRGTITHLMRQVEAIQRAASAREDGCPGPNTMAALQKKLGLPELVWSCELDSH